MEIWTRVHGGLFLTHSVQSGLKAIGAGWPSVKIDYGVGVAVNRAGSCSGELRQFESWHLA